MSPLPWPDDLHPGVCPVHVVDTIDVAAGPALVRAALWPTRYAHVRDLVFTGGRTDLEPDACRLAALATLAPRA